MVLSDRNNRKAFITGASRGIGFSIKEVFERNCYSVIAPNREELDLSSDSSVLSYVQNHDLSDIDIFIHCAGINKLAGISEISKEILDSVFQVNVFSALSLVKAMTPGMKRRYFGRIVLISSLYSIVSRTNRLAYTASKNALTGVAKNLTLELAPFGILTNCVAPGYVMTDMTRKNLSTEEISKIEKNIPTGRFQSEDEIANLVLFLSSEYNQSITGQLIAVDGGFLCN